MVKQGSTAAVVAVWVWVVGGSEGRAEIKWVAYLL